jgi:hypothetical protein
MEPKNGIIKETFLGFDDTGMFTMAVTVSYGAKQQLYGLFALDDFDEETNTRVPTKYCCKCVMEFLKIVDARCWEDLINKPVRVKATDERIEEIGHFMDDVWFDKDKIYANMDLEVPE